MEKVVRKNGFVDSLHKLAQAKWFDWIGVIIVFVCALTGGYLFETLAQVHNFGTWSNYIPFGIISFISAGVSIMSDRLTARLNNLGNWIGLLSVILSGIIDYLLGNHAAVITYPITFIIQSWAIATWIKSDKYKAKAPLTGLKGFIATIGIFALTLIFSYLTNGLGFQQHNLLFYVTTIVFALSLSANILNAMKLTLQWKFWAGYNVIQLFKAFIQGNYANVGKYLYYIIVAIAGLVFWNRTNFDSNN